MKKYLMLVSLITIASTLAVIIADIQNADDKAEDMNDDLMIDYLGV